MNYESGDVESKNQLNYIDLASTNPLQGPLCQGQVFPLCAAALASRATMEPARMLQIPTGWHPDPRVGVSYQFDSKTVIHTGFGIFHHPPAAWQQFPNALGTTRASTSIDDLSNGVTPLFNLSNPFPSGVPLPAGNAAGLAIDLGQNITGPCNDAKAFRIRLTGPSTFNASCRSNLVVTAGYVGNVGVHLIHADST